MPSSKKPRAGDHLRKTFTARMKEIVPEYTLLKPSPEKSFPGSLVFARVVSSELTLFIVLGVDGAKELCWLDGRWSDGEYPAGDLFSRNLTPFEDVMALGYCPEFDQREFAIRISKLRPRPLNSLDKTWRTPTIHHPRFYERKVPLIEASAAEAIEYVQEYAIPYFDALIAYRERKGGSKRRLEQFHGLPTIIEHTIRDGTIVWR